VAQTNNGPLFFRAELQTTANSQQPTANSQQPEASSDGGGKDG
jgi:hypothetical protein